VGQQKFVQVKIIREDIFALANHVQIKGGLGYSAASKTGLAVRHSRKRA
jgi:hypothetical protein